MDIIEGLELACAGAGAVAFAAYLRACFTGTMRRRVAATISLCSLAIALFEMPLFLRNGAEGGSFINGATTVAMLIIATAAQVVDANWRRRTSDRTSPSDDGSSLL
jgi:hypothetical protein